MRQLEDQVADLKRRLQAAKDEKAHSDKLLEQALHRAAAKPAVVGPEYGRAAAVAADATDEEW